MIYVLTNNYVEYRRVKYEIQDRIADGNAPTL